MKKNVITLSLILYSLSASNIFAKGNDDEIPVQEETFWTEEKRNQTPTFHAEVLPNKTIKVVATEISTFKVKLLEVLNATSTTVYQGTTTNGILHISSTSLQTGHYIIQIETAETLYTGNFEISELN